jgi:hypothetical protein
VLEFIFTLIGAVLFRIRGGLLGDFGIRGVGTVASRGIYAVGLALATAALMGDYRLALLAPALFVGCVLPWWKSIDIGTNEGNPWRDALLTSLRGILFTLPAGVVLWWLGYQWWPGLVGILAGPLYALGWQVPSKVRGFERGSAIGEALLGAIIGGSIGYAARISS